MAILKEVFEILPLVTWTIIGLAILAFLLAYPSALAWKKTRLVWTHYQQKRRLATRDISDDEFPKGFIDHQVTFLDTLERIQKVMTAITKSMNRVTKRAAVHTRRMDAARGDPRRAQRIAIDMASDLDKLSESLSARTPMLTNLSKDYIDSFCGILEGVNSQSQGMPINPRDILPDLDPFMHSCEFAKTEMGEYRKSVESLKGYNSTLNGSVELQIASVDGIIEFLDAIHQATEQATDPQSIDGVMANLQSAYGTPDAQTPAIP